MKPENYCLVTQRIGAILEDSPDDGDRFPDYVDVTGVVVFTPVMPTGGAFHVERDGEIMTVPVYPVKALIVDGVLQHEGENGIPLFAAGEGVNPPEIVYRVSYARLKVRDETVTLNSFSFKAIPGGSIDLSTVTPVAGTPSPGITKGDKGDPFLYEDFTPGQLDALKGDPFTYKDFTPQQLAELKGDKGDPGEVTLAQLNQAIRVDTSVGTRVFSGDTMIYGDTGVRRVDSLATSTDFSGSQFHKMTIRRLGDRVTLECNATRSEADRWLTNELPLGFRPKSGEYSSNRGTALVNNSLTPVGNGNTINRISSVGEIISAGSRFEFRAEWATADAWPASLPGTPE